MDRIVKNLAIYLPQFYETEYNNRWWGEGFTDWEAVKKAVPLYENHVQPKVPLNRNYYDPTNIETLKYQSSLMKKYGVDGLCFYHYYFKKGELLLEKPAETLLYNKDIDIPFCFSWPSESWIRTWSNIRGNVWGEKFDKDLQLNGTGVLIEQQFGEQNEWKMHFEYLLKFFKDNRYIRIEDKPVFIFYNATQIRCLNSMVRYWKELAKENGLPGLFIIGMGMRYTNENIDAVMDGQPTKAFTKLNKKGLRYIRNGMTCYRYVDFAEEVISERKIGDCKTFFCCASGYDTSPRRGKNGNCLIDRNPDVFEIMLDALYRKSIEIGSEFVFINAWNEWGEGMYLEPDEESGFSYLEVIKRVSDKYKNSVIACSRETIDLIDSRKQITELRFQASRESYVSSNVIKLMDITQLEANKIKEYLINENIKSIAIYGIGRVGKLLFNELRKEEVLIEYTVDQYTAQIQNICKMYRPEEELPDVDMMIVTSYEYEEIKLEMQRKKIYNVVSVEDFLDKVLLFCNLK